MKEDKEFKNDKIKKETHKSHDEKLNKMSLIAMWILLTAGSLFNFVSKVMQGMDISDIYKKQLIFTLTILVLTLIQTTLHYTLKKHRWILKYTASISLGLFCPLYGYISLGSNHQTWSLGLVVIIFSMFHLEPAIVLFTSIFLYAVDILFNVLFWDTIGPTLHNAKAEFALRFVDFALSTGCAVAITRTLKEVIEMTRKSEAILKEKNDTIQNTFDIVQGLTNTLKKMGGENSEFSEKITVSSESQASSIEQIALFTTIHSIKIMKKCGKYCIEIIFLFF